MLVIGRNGLGLVDVLAHHASKLNAHAPHLKVPCLKAVLMHVVCLDIVKQAVVLLRGNLPLLPTGTKRVILCLHNGGAIENVFVMALDGQPSVLLVVRGIPLAYFEVVGSLPGRQQRRPPIQLAARLGGRVRLVQFGEIGLDGAQVPVYPADQGLVDHVGGDDEEFGVLSSGRNHGWNGRVFDVDLATHVSLVIRARRHRGMGAYDIVVHFDIHDVILNQVVRRGEAVPVHINHPFFVVGLARQEFVEECEVFFFFCPLEEDDAVEDASVLDQIALLFPPLNEQSHTQLHIALTMYLTAPYLQIAVENRDSGAATVENQPHDLFRLGRPLPPDAANFLGYAVCRVSMSSRASGAHIIIVVVVARSIGGPPVPTEIIARTGEQMEVPDINQQRNKHERPGQQRLYGVPFAKAQQHVFVSGSATIGADPSEGERRKEEERGEERK